MVGHFAAPHPPAYKASVISSRIYSGPKGGQAFRPRTTCGRTIYDTQSWPKPSDPNPLPQNSAPPPKSRQYNCVGKPFPFRHEKANHNYTPARMMSERYTSTEEFDCNSGRLLFMTGKPRIKQTEISATNYHESDKVGDDEGNMGGVVGKAGSQTARVAEKPMIEKLGTSYRDQFRLGTLHADKYRTGFVYKAPAFSDALPSSRSMAFSLGSVEVPASPTNTLSRAFGGPPSFPRSAPTSSATSPRANRVKKSKPKINKAMTARTWTQGGQTAFQKHMTYRLGSAWKRN